MTNPFVESFKRVHEPPYTDEQMSQFSASEWGKYSYDQLIYTLIKLSLEIEALKANEHRAS